MKSGLAVSQTGKVRSVLPRIGFKAQSNLDTQNFMLYTQTLIEVWSALSLSVKFKLYTQALIEVWSALSLSIKLSQTLPFSCNYQSQCACPGQFNELVSLIISPDQIKRKEEKTNFSDMQMPACLF